MKKSASKDGGEGTSPSQLIDQRIEELGDWRGEMLALIRRVVKEAEPDVVEEWEMEGRSDLVPRRNDLHG